MKMLHQKVFEVFWVFLKLGLTSFGGPVAHMGYFHQEFVQRRAWLTEQDYADWMALCQFLPGPASSQLGMIIGRLRAGTWGAVAAWVGFTMPSAALLMFMAWGVSEHANWLPVGAIQGLKWVAVAVVAQALWSMGRSFVTTPMHMVIAAVVTLVSSAVLGVWVQLALVLLAGVLGSIVFAGKVNRASMAHTDHRWRGANVSAWVLALLLLALPWVSALLPNSVWSLIDAFFRTGTWVMGGGHVVLPLLEAEVVQPGWVSSDQFLAGYGLAQAVPGPLFTLAAYLGAVSPWGWAAGWLSLAAIFLPSFLWIFAAMPHWQRWRQQPRVQHAMSGVHAAVWGLLLSAWIHPVVATSVHYAIDVLVISVLLALLIRFKLSALWAVVLAISAGLLVPALGLVDHLHH